MQTTTEKLRLVTATPPTTQHLPTAASTGLLPRPSLLAPVLWDEPATVADVVSLVSTVVALFQPKAGTDEASEAAEAAHISLLVNLVAARGYSRGEVAHAMHEMPYDEEMNAKLRYKAPVTPADFEACINRVREHRAMLRTPQTEEGMRSLLSKYSELKREHFHQCGFDARNAPIYRWVDPEKRKDGRAA